MDIALTGLTFLIGWAGAWLFSKLNLKAGYMVGALLAVAVFNLLFETAFFPLAARPIIQVISGCFVSMNITKESLQGMKQLAMPLLVYFLCITMVPAAAGCLVAAVTDLNLATAILAGAPGGATDMTLLSYEYNADTSCVAILNIMRLVLGLSVFPLLSQVYAQKFPPKYTVKSIEHAHDISDREQARSPKNIILTALVASAGGAIGYAAGISAGVLSFAVLAVTGFNLLTCRAFMPVRVRHLAQVCAGAIIGMSITRAGMMELGQLIVPFAIIMLQYLFLNYVVAPAISRIFHLDLLTMLLACTPAGVTNTALIADEMGCDSSYVALFQMVRLLSTLTVYPYLLNLLTILLPRL